MEDYRSYEQRAKDWNMTVEELMEYEKIKPSGVMVDESSQANVNTCSMPMGFSTPAPSGDEREQILIHQSALNLAEKDIRFLDNCRQDLSRELAQAKREIERLKEEREKIRYDRQSQVSENLAKWQKEKSVLIGALQYIARPRQWLSRLCARPNETMSVQECAQRALNLTGNGIPVRTRPDSPEMRSEDAAAEQELAAELSSEDRYRILVIGEIVRQGDEILEASGGWSEWMKVNTSVGGRVTAEHKWRRHIPSAAGDGC